MDSGAFVIMGGAVALLLLSRRDSEAAKAKISDKEWQPALLSEYHPDAPDDEQQMEGGKYDRNPREKTRVITVQQFQQDRTRYPYVSVSADLVLRGQPACPLWGARIFGRLSRYHFSISTEKPRRSANPVMSLSISRQTMAVIRHS